MTNEHDYDGPMWLWAISAGFLFSMSAAFAVGGLWAAVGLLLPVVWIATVQAIAAAIARKGGAR